MKIKPTQENIDRLVELLDEVIAELEEFTGEDVAYFKNQIGVLLNNN